jgi:tetratricopeptide (TPR) repeat protein
MTRRVRSLWLLLPALALIAAAPVASDELLRRGNDAASRQDYAEALKLYGQAEDRATDPGQVAFNEGVALYRDGQFDQAVKHFRLARQDATGRRQLWTAYNLAASLVQDAGDSNADKLSEAVSLFEECLRHDEAGEGLAADVRHNLELAKALWVKAKTRPAQPKDDRSHDDENSNPPPHKPEPVQQPDGSDPQSIANRGGGDRVRVPQGSGQEPIKTNEQPSPGPGNLPVIPDSAELVPMSPDEAEAHLREASRKVLDEGRVYRNGTGGVLAGRVRDY